MNFTGHQVLQPVGDTEVQIHVTCPYCGRHFVSAPVAEERILRVLRGERVQDVFPEWTPAVREKFLMTGICEECWPRSEEGDAGPTLVAALEQIAVFGTILGIAKAASVFSQA